MHALAYTHNRHEKFSLMATYNMVAPKSRDENGWVYEPVLGAQFKILN